MKAFAATVAVAAVELVAVGLAAAAAGMLLRRAIPISP